MIRLRQICTCSTLLTSDRRGEMCAIAWPDIDFNRREARVSKSLEQTKAGLRIKATKSEKPRVISLPRSAIAMLRELRSRQAENRRHCGGEYRDDLNLVFCTPDGNYLKSDSVSAKVSLLAKKAGIDASLHTLRHSHGSLLLANHTPLPVVSRRLGHSSVHVTATIYSHALTPDEVAVGDTWDAIERTISAGKSRAETS